METPENEAVDNTMSEAKVANPTAGDFVRPKLPTWRLISLSACIYFGLFLSLLDTTIVATALYTIGVDLNSLETVTWVALSYTLSYLGCAVIFARIGDIVGRRNALVAAFLIFFAFSLGCGFARTLNELIACRALQGIGGSGLYSLTFVILTELTPPNESKGKIMGAVTGFVVAMAGVLGPVLGGVITHFTTWRWIFWINPIIGIVPLTVFILAWPKPHQLVPIHRHSWKELDIVGCVLLVASTVLVVFSFQEAGIRGDVWSKAIFLAPLLVGLLCAFLLFAWEISVARTWEERIATIFPLRLMKRRVYMGYVLSTLLIGFPYLTVLFALPLRMQVVERKTALMAGISLLPTLGAVAISSMISGALNGTKDRRFPTLLMGTIFMMIGCAALSTIQATGGAQKGIYGFQVFIGLGFGLTITTASISASLESEMRDNAVAQGIVAQVRIFGGSIGIAASTAILGVSQRRHLSGLVSASELANLQAFARTATLEQLLAIRTTYAEAFSTDMKVSAAVAGVAILATIMTFSKEKMDPQTRFNERITQEGDRRRRQTPQITSEGIAES